MAGFDILELLKRLRGEQEQTGLLGAQAEQPAAEQAPAQAAPTESGGGGLLGSFMPSDPSKREAMAMALMSGGANMMAAGGPSTTPMNFGSALGAGFGGGVQAYQEAMKNDAAIGASRSKVRSDQLKMQQAQDAQDFANTIDANGNNPFSIEFLKKYLKRQIASGDDEGARATMALIQRLDDEQRKDGRVLDENGNYVNADGTVDSAREMEEGKAAGRVAGEESQKLTDDIREYNLYRDQEKAKGLEPMEFRQWVLDQKRASAQQITIGGGTDKQFFDTMLEQNKTAQQNVKGLTAIGNARQSVQDGAILGAGADFRLGLQKIGAYLGVTDSDKISNTETFRSAIAPQVAAMLKETVGSTQISDNDRAFAEKAAGGSIDLDEKTILRLLDIMERMNRVSLENYQRRVDTIYPEGKGFDRERAILQVSVPEPVAPKSKADKKGPRLLGATAPTTGNDTVTDDQGVKYRYIGPAGGNRNDPKNWEEVR